MKGRTGIPRRRDTCALPTARVTPLDADMNGNACATPGMLVSAETE
jgi:hypothetical protein